MSTSSPALDHLILFVPANPDTQLPEVPAFFKNNFTLTPGGFHADGATSNVLILLADGCYIEIISFINLDSAPAHWWGPDANFDGWKDWCLTNNSTPEENYEKLKDMHAQPIHGGRKRADGVDVKWAVTFPKGDKGGQDVRGRIPFFCHDITSRNIRVPIDDKKTTHPSGALGVRQLTVIVKDQALLDETSGIYTKIFGQQGVKAENKVSFLAKRVIQDIEGPGYGAKIVLRLPESKAESENVDKSGYSYAGVILFTKSLSGEDLAV